MKQVCTNCQFFIRHYRNERGADHTLEIPNDHRRKAEGNDFSWRRESEALECFKGIWDEGYSTSGQSMHQIVALQNRKNKCYFLEFQPGMLLPAADKLQQEIKASAGEKQRLRYTIYALVVAILGLLARLVYERVA